MWLRCGRKKLPVGKGIIRAAASYDVAGRTPLPFRAIPGPKPLPIIGNSLEMWKNLENLRLYFQEGFKKYGDVYKIKGVGKTSTVLVKDPSTIESVLRAEGKYPTRELSGTPRIAWLYQNVLNQPPPLAFKSDKDWKEQRSAMGKQIIPRNVTVWHDSFNDIIHRFTNHIRSTIDTDGTVKDISSPIRRLLIEISAMLNFGSEWNVVANPSEKEEEFMAGFAFLMTAIGQAPYKLPIYKLYNNKFSRDLKNAIKVLEKHSKLEVKRIAALVEAGKESPRPGLLEQWLREKKFSEEMATYEAIALFPGAVDTTANQATFLLHAIARNEEVQERLYDEIRSVLGSSKLPLPEHLAKMPYMKGCLHESYRLYPTVPTLARLLEQDAVFHGYQVPAKTTIFYCTYTAGRDESLFPNPLKFDPERWKRDDTHAFAIQLFGVGPRACYGRRFAELELKLFLIQMVSNFKISATKDMKFIERGIVAPKGDVAVKLMERNTA